ncbi:MAG: aromatic ring-hydroxylating dioxygenase subunit alpha [Pseudomonadota bacterium]
MGFEDLKSRMADFRPLGSDAESSPALPGFLYNDPTVLEAEKQKIFYRSWQVIAHQSELPHPGDYLCTNIADEPVFVIRQRDGQIAGFYNVCQHRAHQVLSGAGNVKGRIICPYHAWAYDFDGSLVAARATNKLPGFDRADFNLEPLRLEIACGLIFANLDPQAPSLESQAGDLFADICQALPWIEELTVAPASTRHAWEGDPLAANWKVLAENCLECYHCAPAHPAFADLIDLKSYGCVPHGGWLKSIGKLGKPDNKAYWLAEDEPVTAATFWHMWPNNQFGVLPGERTLAVFRFYPETAETTRMSARLLTLPDESVPQDRLDYRWNVLWPEDEALCESVHIGLKSRGYRQGRFVVNPDQPGIAEHGVHYFQKLYAEAMGL